MLLLFHVVEFLTYTICEHRNIMVSTPDQGCLTCIDR